mgnify:FL=1
MKATLRLGPALVLLLASLISCWEGLDSVYDERDPLPFRVFYYGNGNTGGDVPRDDTAYGYEDTVTVAGNTGSLAKMYSTFIGWNSAPDGTGTTYAPGNIFKIIKNRTVLFAQWIDTSHVGGSGPAGGLIFYENPNAVADGWRYLEAAPPDLGGGTAYSWNDAVANCGSYSYGGYDDWFLPTLTQLDYMYVNLRNQGLGNFDTIAAYYWSSTELDAGNAWYEVFDNRSQGTTNKGNGCLVRPARQF